MEKIEKLHVPFEMGRGSNINQSSIMNVLHIFWWIIQFMVALCAQNVFSFGGIMTPPDVTLPLFVSIFPLHRRSQWNLICIHRAKQGVYNFPLPGGYQISCIHRKYCAIRMNTTSQDKIFSVCFFCSLLFSEIEICLSFLFKFFVFFWKRKTSVNWFLFAHRFASIKGEWLRW